MWRVLVTLKDSGEKILLAEKFDTRAEAETFSGIESLQIEAENVSSWEVVREHSDETVLTLE